MATRRERVVLDLEDKFSGPMARAAAAAALLNKELNSLDKNSAKTGSNLDKNAKASDALGKSLSGLNKQIGETNKNTDGLADRALPRLGRQSESTGNQIDRMSGRLRLFGEAALVLGPALIPIGGAVVPALSAMAMGMTVAAAAAGTAVLAFKGMGEGLKALDKAQLEPTVENLQKLRDEMDKLGPAGAHFVRFLDSLEPQLASLQMAARDGLLPGVEDGIRELLTSLPQVREFVHGLATEMGNLAEATGEGLTGDGFEAFFNYMRTDAASTLSDFAHTLGNVTEGVANLMVAFAPLTRDFTGGMESMTASFADWAAGLSETDGFRGFVSYIEDTGPQVLDTLGALANAFVGIIQAAAPVGQAILPMLTGLANVLGVIAASPIGPPLYSAAAALVLINRSSLLAAASMKAFGVSAATSTAAATRFGGALKVAALGIGGLMVLDSLVNSTDKTAVGVQTLTSALLDLGATGAGADIDGVTASIERLLNPDWDDSSDDWLRDKLPLLGDNKSLKEAKMDIDSLDAALAGLVATSGAGGAARAFDDLAQSMGLSAAEQRELKALLPQYTDAVAGASNATRKYGAATDSAADAARKSRAEIRGMVTAMQEQRKAALAGFDATTAWGQALADARKQARSGARGLDELTEGGRKNRAALSQLAGAWNSQSAAVKNNISKFAAARDAFIQTATAMGVPRRAAEQLANKLMEIPRSVVTHVTVNTGTALSALAQARAALDAMNGRTATMHLVTVRSGPGGQAGSEYRMADGGTIPKTGRAYADRHLLLAADGEEVISNRYGQADKHRDLLKAINANRLADGGTVARYAAAARSNASHSGGTSAPIVVSAQSLKGLAIEGRISVDGMEGHLRGTIREEIGAVRNHDSARSRAQTYRGTDAY